MTFRNDFRQLKNRHRDDAFAETVLGSQGNMEDLERSASAARSD